VTPSQRSWPPGRLILGSALLGGLAVGGGLVLVRQFFDPRVLTRRQLSACSRHRVIGVIPTLGRAGSMASLLRTLAARKQPRVHKHFFMLQHAVRSGQRGHAMTVLLLTSSGSGEGKSTLALNLAVTAALDGERVLLIDGDLERRTLSRHLAKQPAHSGSPKQGIGRAVGFSDILKGLSTLEVFVTFPKLARLAVLPAGCSDDIDSDMDASELAQRLLSKIENFSFVIVDAGCARSGRLVRNLAAIADKILIVVSAGRTRLEDLDVAVDILDDAPGRIFDIVINAARGRRG
jgi:polysaccharide biosynthesis transport protein